MSVGARWQVRTRPARWLAASAVLSGVVAPGALLHAQATDTGSTARLWLVPRLEAPSRAPASLGLDLDWVQTRVGSFWSVGATALEGAPGSWRAVRSSAGVARGPATWITMDASSGWAEDGRGDAPGNGWVGQLGADVRTRPGRTTWLGAGLGATLLPDAHSVRLDLDASRPLGDGFAGRAGAGVRVAGHGRHDLLAQLSYASGPWGGVVGGVRSLGGGTGTGGVVDPLFDVFDVFDVVVGYDEVYLGGHFERAGSDRIGLLVRHRWSAGARRLSVSAVVGMRVR